MNNKRNGDWTFAPINMSDYTNALKGKEAAKHNGSFVFAEGEATGHFHIVKVANPDDLEIIKLDSGEYVMHLKSEGTVTHPEHSVKTDLTIQPGTYKLMQRREKDWLSLSVRRVID